MKGIQFKCLGKKSVITQAITISSVRVTKGAATVCPLATTSGATRVSADTAHMEGGAA